MVRVAPMSIPVARRLQTGSVALVLFMYLIFLIINILVVFSPLVFLWLPYAIWALFFDQAPYNGTRASSFVRSLPLWKHFRDFFPARLIRSTEEPLDPKKQYIFGLHPHGIIGISAFSNFANDNEEWKSEFPGINLRIATLPMNFKLPIYREWLLSLGFITSDRKSIVENLKRKHSVMIVIGGAAEALLAHPGTETELVLKKRKGFVRLALETGSNLVPVFGFGENDLYKQVPNPKGSKLRNIQEKLKNLLGFSMPLFFGRGIFLYDYGVLPQRKKLMTVVGTPIEVPLTPNPSDEEVDKYHQLYIQPLENLFEEYKVVAEKSEQKLKFS